MTDCVSSFSLGGVSLQKSRMAAVIFSCCWIFCLVGLIQASPESVRLAEATLVLYNINDPDAAALARYYAQRRGISNDHILGLDCPTVEEISRTDFEESIASPLRGKLVSGSMWIESQDERPGIVSTKIRFLALIRGIPLKIKPDLFIPAATNNSEFPPELSGRNEASVDSELAALGLPDYTPSGAMRNPIFNRNSAILDDTMPPGLLLPCRLDAPTPDLVGKMIDDSMDAEKKGLWGWACIDARGITEGAYKEGDTWLLKIAALLRSHGIPTIFDNEAESFAADFPLSNVALYYGWYDWQISGPFAEESFRFVPGAVAVHIHSFSASTLHGANSYWCGPLIAHGAAATLGNVYEPFLSFTANLDIFQDRLMDGLTLAESGWMAQRALSWMGIVVGDPLYHPYAAWNDFVDPRSSEPNNWRKYRSIIRLANKQSVVPKLIDAAKGNGDSMFLEALANNQMVLSNPSEAIETFRLALQYVKNKSDHIRIEKEIAAAERALVKKRIPMSTEPREIPQWIPK